VASNLGSLPGSQNRDEKKDESRERIGLMKKYLHTLVVLDTDWAEKE